MKSALDHLLETAQAPQRRMMAASMLCAVAAAAVAVLLLGLSGWFIAAAAIAGMAGILTVQGFNYLMPSAAIRLLAIIRTAARYGERYCSHSAALMTLATLRSRLFAHLLARSDLRAISAGEAVTRLVQDIGAIEDQLIRKPAMPAAVAGSAIGAGLCFLAGPPAALAVVAILIALPAVARGMATRLLVPRAHVVAEAQGMLKEEFTAWAAASPEITAYGMSAPVIARLERHARALDEGKRALALGEGLIGGLTPIATGMAMAGILSLSTGSVPFTVMAMLAAAGAVECLSGLIQGISREAAVAAARARIAELADKPAERPPGHPLPSGCRIDLMLPDRQISLAPGDRLAILGPSGGGKTRLLETLAGLRPGPDAGIRIDGRPLSEIDVVARRVPFALSPQDTLLISGSVADNLRLARPAVTEMAMWEALEAACLADDIRADANGLQYWVGDGGARLSGGQRKRLSIARALLAERRWLLLDEPSEGLDPETEATLIDRLDRWLRHRKAGLILVTHSPDMQRLSDRSLTIGA